MSERVPSDASLGLENAPEVLQPVSLTIEGAFPTWLSGSLYRTGPGTFRIPSTAKDSKADSRLDVHHWFDSLGMTHRFDVHGGDGRTPPEVRYMSRSTAKGRAAAIQANDSWVAKEASFGQFADPCESYFAKFFTFFKRVAAGNIRPTGTDNDNVSVTLSPAMPGFARYAADKPAPASSHSATRTPLPAYIVAKTDANRLQVLDAETLEPRFTGGYFEFDKRLAGPLAASHVCADPETGDVYNFVLSLGSTTRYTLFRLRGGSIGDKPASDGTVDILAEITDAPPAYLHSFFMTEKYLVLCVWQADFAFGGLAVLWNGNMAQSIQPWNPVRETLFYVVDRHRGGVVAKYTAPSFFAFHAINAYDDGDDVIIDLATYKDTAILDSLYLDRMRKTHGPEHLLGGRARRYCLPEVSAHPGIGHAADGEKNRPAGPNLAPGAARLDFELPPSEALELPTVHPAYAWRRYRYTYGIGRGHPHTPIADQLVKLDMHAAAASASPASAEPSGAPKLWYEDGCTPGEPIFVARPGGTDEDDGVLLSVVLDPARGRSALICLDARDMREVGRAAMDAPFPLGFHGVFVG